jgi:hypothetical protein
MTESDTTRIAEAYSQKFNNADEICHPAIIFQDSFYELLQVALDRGTPLTPAEVDKRFPDLNWEW